MFLYLLRRKISVKQKGGEYADIIFLYNKANYVH